LAFNNLVRAGIAGEYNYFDTALIIDPAKLQVWPVSPIAGTTTGTANFATTDGIHETPAMNKAIAAALTPFTNWINLH
jgi:hypothetical protein